MYFGGKPTKTQMFNPQLQTLHSSHVKFTERFSRSRRPESKAKCRFCYFKIRTAQLNVFKLVTLHQFDYYSGNACFLFLLVQDGLVLFQTT